MSQDTELILRLRSALATLLVQLLQLVVAIWRVDVMVVEITIYVERLSNNDFVFFPENVLFRISSPLSFGHTTLYNVNLQARHCLKETSPIITYRWYMYICTSYFDTILSLTFTQNLV